MNVNVNSKYVKFEQVKFNEWCLGLNKYDMGNKERWGKKKKMLRLPKHKRK